MEDFLKMDVFFIVATIAVLIVAVLTSIALVYLIRILRTVSHISEEVQGEAVALREDIDGLRQKARSEGLRLKHIFDIFGKAGKRLLTTGRRKS